MALKDTILGLIGRKQQAEISPRADRAIMAVARSKQALFEQIKESLQSRSRAEIGKWRTALNAAESTIQPNRRYLYEIYREVLLDAHLASTMNTRIMRITGAPCKFHKDGQPIEDRPDLEKLRHAMWFRQLVAYTLESMFWGHSLIEVSAAPDRPDGIATTLIPRRNVFPEYGLLTMDGNNPAPTSDVKSWAGYLAYNELPFMLIEADPSGSGKYLGLLNELAPLAIYSRNVLASWVEFCHIFGMPFRIGKTDGGSEREREMSRVLDEMGSAAWAVMQTSESIEFQEGTYSDAFKVFLELIKRNDDAMSKLVIGQTMTADNGSSRSQAEVHMAIFDQISASDAAFVESVINGQLLPKLAAAGLVQGLDGLEFKYTLFEREEPLAEQFKREVELAKLYNIPAEFFADKYGITGITDKQQDPQDGSDPNTQEEQGEDPAADAADIRAMVTKLYHSSCAHPDGSAC